MVASTIRTPKHFISWLGIWMDVKPRKYLLWGLATILNNSRKDSTRKCYLAKWKHFSIWAQQKHISSETADSPAVLDLLWRHQFFPLIHCKSTWWQSACVTCHQIFTQPVTKFLKGLMRTFPPVNKQNLQRDLNLGLLALTKSPFEQLAMCSMFHLLMKVAFLIAITLARRVSELGALTTDPPYAIFHEDKFLLWPTPKIPS